MTSFLHKTNQLSNVPAAANNHFASKLFIIQGKIYRLHLKLRYVEWKIVENWSK